MKNDSVDGVAGGCGAKLWTRNGDTNGSTSTANSHADHVGASAGAVGLPAIANPGVGPSDLYQQSNGPAMAREAVKTIKQIAERVPCARCTSDIYCEMNGCQRPSTAGVAPAAQTPDGEQR